MEAQDDSYEDTPVVHRLLHPNQDFPVNLFKKRIPKSPFIKQTEKKAMWLILIVAFPLLCASAGFFAFTFRYDVLFSYDIHNLKGVRNSSEIPNIVRYGDGYAIPLINVTVHRIYYHRLSKYSYEEWNFYYGNVSCNDFCYSESEELTWKCFSLSFPHNGSSGTFYYIRNKSPFLNDLTLGRHSTFMLDNEKYQFKFVTPMYHDNAANTSDTVFIISIVVSVPCLIVGLCISLYILRHKLVTNYLSKDEIQLVEQNIEIVNSFKKRVILQEVYENVKYDPEKRSLFKYDTNGMVVINENIGETERKLVATLLESDEEIISYEILGLNLISTITDSKLAKFIRIAMACVCLLGIPLIVFGVVFINIISFAAIFPIVLLIYYMLIMSIVIKSPKVSHYILTNRQLIIIESGFQINIFTISLSDISHIWTRSISFEDDNGNILRRELLVKLGEGDEYYNSGVLVVNVTDPQYYIDTIQKLRQEYLK